MGIPCALKHRNGMLKTQQQTSVSSVTSRVSNSEKKPAKILRLSDKYNKMKLPGFAKPKLPEHYSIKSSEKPSDRFRCSYRYVNENRPFCCVYCGKTFSSENTLKIHDKVHSGKI